MSDTDNNIDPRLVQLSTALVLEQEIRAIRHVPELTHHITTASRRVHDHEMAILWRIQGKKLTPWAVSDLPHVVPEAPLTRWLTEQAKPWCSTDSDNTIKTVILSTADSPLTDRVVPTQGVWIPLLNRNKKPLGALLLLREHPWQKRELMLAETVSGCYGHALDALLHRPRWWPKRSYRWPVIGLSIAALILIKLPLTAVGTAEIVPEAPIIIAAPFQGVVRQFHVHPYQQVETGTLLVTFDPSERQAERDQANKALDVAQAELEQLRFQAYEDLSSKDRQVIWQKKVALRRQAVEHAQKRLDLHQLYATESGVVFFDDRYGWEGRPVAIGQRLMSLADPTKTRLEVEIPVEQMVPVDYQAEVRFFADMDPTHARTARLTQRGLEAHATSTGQAAYRHRAVIDQQAHDLPIGARGTARISGEPVRLWFYLFRRPWVTLRQFIGW
ncbi:MAG: efflux RND transporter periplasmic adaptor subunit [Magnetococcales bacterium]|nr:efflux RND transporter periplasmic adaptor subunit [Magnetococcales bacterium]